jgi:ribosomal RNA-processing protein 8
MQTLDSTKPPSNGVGPVGDGTDAAAKPSKKRKRSNRNSKALDVSPTSLADLWETVIEGKLKSKTKEWTVKHARKRQKRAKDEGPDDSVQHPEDAVTPKEKLKKSKIPKENKMDREAGPKQIKNVSTETNTAHIASKAQPPRTGPRLTPLQASMRQKLVSARFRHLNQTLYTTPSAQSLELFNENPEMFQEYHEGFRRQVEVWPENPVDGYISQIKQRGKQKGPERGKGKADIKGGIICSEVLPLPRTEGTSYIADLGCGDARLSQGIQRDSKKLKLKIYSYDLHTPSPLITKADIANLPLDDGSIDVAIFCLALMGTNWIDFIEEAFRILRWKGELWIAEIRSRFGRVNGKNKQVEHSVGNRKKPDKKPIKKMEGGINDADLMIEVNGHEKSKQETNVSTFVEVLRKRGFVLQSERAVDLSNKMFVKMHFVKGLTPIKGKCVPIPKGMAEMGMETWKKPKARFLDVDAEVPILNEATVLKPCVYKLR